MKWVTAEQGTPEWHAARLGCLTASRMVDEGTTSFTRIPLVPIYTNRVGFMEGTPPFQSAAELNLRHWRSTSEQTMSLTYHRNPIICAIGVNSDTALRVGPAQLFMSPNPDASFHYLEMTGKALEAGREDLKGIEAAINTAAATLRVERAGQVTATAAAIDSEETCAGLKAIAHGIKDSIEELFRHFAEMSGLPREKAGTILINTDFGAPKGTPQGLTVLQTLNVSGQLSTDALLRELAYRGELSPEFDNDMNAEELAIEAATMPDMTTPPEMPVMPAGPAAQ